MLNVLVLHCIAPYPRRQDVKNEIKRDPRGNTTVTDLTMESVDPNDGAGVDEIMQVCLSLCCAGVHEYILSVQ